MMDIILVYDYVGPNGYIPFNYKKDNISSILHNEQYRCKPRTETASHLTKVLTKDIKFDNPDVRDNLYLILIDRKLENIEPSEILSETLILLLREYPNNLKIIYVNFNKDTMHTFL
jgi:hypothetical protein